MLLSTVDVVFADVAQPDQARIVNLNAEYFLKNGGHCVISIKASCIDSTMPAEAVFAQEVNKLREGKFKPLEQISLEPYERDHAMVSGGYHLQILRPTRLLNCFLFSRCIPTAPVDFSQWFLCFIVASLLALSYLCISVPAQKYHARVFCCPM